MPNERFATLLDEHIATFADSFSKISRDVFQDDTAQNGVIHAGEFGGYREGIARRFLRALTPKHLAIGTGFLINSEDATSTQVDVVVYDEGATPLIQSHELQRFFPVETVVAIGEIKSRLSKDGLKKTLLKLAKVKALREHVQSPSFIKRDHSSAWSPKTHHYDNLVSFVICDSFDFPCKTLVDDLDEIYGDVPQCRRHNFVVSLVDGILFYVDHNKKSLPYPLLHPGVTLNPRFTAPAEGSNVHLRFLAAYYMMVLSSASVLYPEMTNYMRPVGGGINYDLTIEIPS
jgi:hypothetical protein